MIKEFIGEFDFAYELPEGCHVVFRLVYFVAGEDGLGRALAHSDVIVMDEVGPMELVSDEFVQAVLKAIGSNKQVI